MDIHEIKNLSLPPIPVQCFSLPCEVIFSPQLFAYLGVLIYLTRSLFEGGHEYGK
jgi:hypothetical protein